MEVEKRKREGDAEAAVSPKREKSGEAAAAVAPGDDEVEEFFEILKRYQVAVKYFKRRLNGGGVMEKAAAAWRPWFEWGDFDGGVKRGKAEVEDHGQKTGLDLNTDPSSDASGSVSDRDRKIAEDFEHCVR